MSAKKRHVEQEPRPGSVPTHKGTNYIEILIRTHQWLTPMSYLEIGTNAGHSLSIAKCAAVAVDPKFILGTRDVIGPKPFCALFQMPADAFFRRHDPTRILDGPIDLAFLDRMHYCEYLLRDFAN